MAQSIKSIKHNSKDIIKTDKKGTKTVKRRERDYIDIYKVLRQIHPASDISGKAMSIKNISANYVFEKIATVANIFDSLFKPICSLNQYF